MHIKVWREFTIRLLITGLELKDWIDEECEMNFLQQSVKEIEEQLENESTSGDNTRWRVPIKLTN